MVNVNHTMLKKCVECTYIDTCVHTLMGSVAESVVCPVLCYQEAVASRSNAYVSLAGWARQLALEEFKAEMSGTWPSAGGLQQMAADGGAADDESESSMPCSIPSDVEAAKNKR